MPKLISPIITETPSGTAKLPSELAQKLIALYDKNPLPEEHAGAGAAIGGKLPVPGEGKNEEASRSRLCQRSIGVVIHAKSASSARDSSSRTVGFWRSDGAAGG